MSYTVAQKIVIAKISQYMAANDIEKSGYYGGGEDLRLSRKLYLVRQNVEWLYNLDPTNDTLEATSNYLYALCGKYSFSAVNAISGGGSISPVSPISGLPEPYDWVVGATTSATEPLKDGDTSVTLSDFIGYNVEFTRNNLTQNTSLPADGTSTWYSWNRVTGLFTLNNGAATSGEQFRILPTR